VARNGSKKLTPLSNIKQLCDCDTSPLFTVSFYARGAKNIRWTVADENLFIVRHSLKICLTLTLNIK